MNFCWRMPGGRVTEPYQLRQTDSPYVVNRGENSEPLNRISPMNRSRRR